MKQFLIKMFSDKSDINPKTVVGFISFVTMIVYGVTDVVTGAMHKDFVIEPIVFNGLMYTNKNLEKKTQEPETEA